MRPSRLLGLIAIAGGAYLVLSMARALHGEIIMLVVALFITFAMEPAVQWMAKHGMRRGPATGLVFVGVAVGSVALIAAFIPLIVDQINNVVDAIPRNVDEVNSLLAQIPFANIQLEEGTDLQAELSQFTEQLSSGTILLGAAGNVVSFGASVFGAIAQTFTIGLITYYLVADGPRWRRALARPLPERRQRELLAVWEVAVEKTGGYISSRVLLALVTSTSTIVALWLIGLPYPIPLGLWVGLTSAFIPVIGTYLGGALPILVALTSGQPYDALFTLLFILVFQQIDNYWISPRLQSHTMNIHPAVAFMSVIIGGALLGAVGALLALPAVAIAQALLSSYLERNEIIAELQLEEEEEEERVRAGGTREARARGGGKE